MRILKALAGIPALAVLLVAAPIGFAMMSIEIVSKERAKELGLEVRSNAAGPDAVRVELEFATKAFPGYSRVDLEIHEGGKLLSSSTLREEPAKPGRVIVSFAADRAKLGLITLRIVSGAGTREMTGHDIPIKEFVAKADKEEQGIKAEVRGTLHFESGRGYFISVKSDDKAEKENRVWLRISEDKALVGQLQGLDGKEVIVKGKLKQMPEGSGANIPPLSMYFSRFEIEGAGSR